MTDFDLDIRITPNSIGGGGVQPNATIYGGSCPPDCSVTSPLGTCATTCASTCRSTCAYTCTPGGTATCRVNGVQGDIILC